MWFRSTRACEIDAYYRISPQVDALSGRGATALHAAAVGGHPQAARVLVLRGAALHALDEHGMTALELADERDHQLAAHLLRAVEKAAEGKAREGKAEAERGREPHDEL